jgi:hypothetical protein
MNRTNPNLSFSIAREHPSFCMCMYYAAPRLLWANETPTALMMMNHERPSFIVRGLRGSEAGRPFFLCHFCLRGIS